MCNLCIYIYIEINNLYIYTMNNLWIYIYTIDNLHIYIYIRCIFVEWKCFQSSRHFDPRREKHLVSLKAPLWYVTFRTTAAATDAGHQLTHLCPPLRSTFAVRETASLGIRGAPRVPPLNPSETIVLSVPLASNKMCKKGWRVRRCRYKIQIFW